MNQQLRNTATLVAFLVLPFTGCFQNDGVVSPATPGPEMDSGSALSLGRFAPSAAPTPAPDPAPVADDPKPESVSAVLGPDGGTIAVGRIAVQFPEGSLPEKEMTITLTAWEDGDAYYFTVEPRKLSLLKPAGFTFLMGESKDGLTYSWNDKGWREPMPSWLNEEGTLLLSEADFLGEFVVAPPVIIDGRAGW